MRLDALRPVPLRSCAVIVGGHSGANALRAHLCAALQLSVFADRRTASAADVAPSLLATALQSALRTLSASSRACMFASVLDRVGQSVPWRAHQSSMATGLAAALRVAVAEHPELLSGCQCVGVAPQ